MTDQLTNPRAIIQATALLESMEVMVADQPDPNFAATFDASDSATLFALLLMAERAVSLVAEHAERPAADVRRLLRSQVLMALSLEEIES